MQPLAPHHLTRIIDLQLMDWYAKWAFVGPIVQTGKGNKAITKLVIWQNLREQISQ